jgi:hypothetical protein
MYSVRWILLVILVLYVVFELFIPAMQDLLGYGFGTLVALAVLYAFFANRFGGPRVGPPL